MKVFFNMPPVYHCLCPLSPGRVATSCEWLKRMEKMSEKGWMAIVGQTMQTAGAAGKEFFLY